jgi:glycosyltransferase involved in cell wall biosynthesis
MRKRFIQSHFSLIDQFLAPSRFLLDRYVEWGIPRERIRFEPYGRRPVSPAPDPQPDRPRNRLGYFGQINPFKGVDVLLEAMKIVGRAQRSVPAAEARESRSHLWLHGANLEIQPAAFQHKLRSLVAASRNNVTLCGRYEHEDLPALMAGVDWVVVPSTWWENAPLVIDEAFMHGRPVICSGVGGMAEKVRHGVDGLHFRLGDPRDLARSIAQAVHTPGLWEQLREGIPEVYPMSQHVHRLGELYQALFERRTAHGNGQ